MKFKIEFGRKSAKLLAEEMILSCFNDIHDPLEAADRAAYWLFSVTVAEFGLSHARRIFMKFGKEPSPKKLKKIKNAGVLSRYDMMKEPNVAELARQLFAENQALPKGKRSTTTLGSWEKHITRLKKDRERRLKDRTWWGPVTQNQAVKYFGARAEKPESRRRAKPQ